jgi:hypothetical protein
MAGAKARGRRSGRRCQGRRQEASQAKPRPGRKLPRPLAAAGTWLGRYGWHILAALFFLYVLGVSTRFALNDPDIWWHLATGKYIVEHKEIPSHDPFSYTTPRPLNENQKRGLRAHWLGQVVFYSAYSLGGLKGVGLFRGLLIILPAVAIYLWLVERGARPWLAISAVAFSTLMLAIEVFYAFERPQGISFFLALVVLMLLEDLRTRRKPALLLLPLVMVLWANVHAGFIVGNVLIMAYASGVLLGWLYGLLRGRPGPFNWFFFLGVALAILGSFVNPNAYHLFYGYLKGLLGAFFRDVSGFIGRKGEGSWVAKVVLEYRPLYYFYKVLFYKWIVYYWLFSALVVALLALKYWLRRRPDLAELFVVAFVIFFSNYYARGLMFGLVILAFYAGKTMLELWHLRGRLIPLVATGLMVALAVGFLSHVWRPYSWALKNPGLTRHWITPWYPIGAANFVKRARIAPPMYNFYTWGGFLIWSLYPQYKVFIDGRAIDEMVNRVADAILKTYPGWRQQLDAYGINFMIIPVVFRESGNIIPLAVALVNEPQWRLIYLGSNSAVLVRDVPQNRHLIERYEIPKRNIYVEIVKVENILLSASPQNPTYNINKADALMALGRQEEALAIYRRFRPWARDRLKALGQE